jgi:hypothetical protein
MRFSRTYFFTAYVAGLLFAAFLMDLCNITSAQGQDHQAWQADVVSLARLCVNEAGWPSPEGSNDCAAIGRYARARADSNNETVAAYIARVHWRHTSPTRRTRVWVRGLNAELTEPTGWPADLDWATWGRVRWNAALEDAAQILRGRRTACTETPHTWGGYIDRERIARMLANGYRQIDCGSTRNVFMRRG